MYSKDNEVQRRIRKSDRLLINKRQESLQEKLILEIVVVDVSPSGKYVKGETVKGEAFAGSFRWYDVVEDWEILENLTE